MFLDDVELQEYSDRYRPQILSVWEKSVRATHEFLTPTDFEEIKELVSHINFHDFQVYCLAQQDSVLGFIGVADKKIEMLFLDPDFIGKGLGRRLLSFAINNLQADQLDVNEQNTKAVKFYQNFGFEPFERTEQDDQGRNYPLLRMKLVQK